MKLCYSRIEAITLAFAFLCASTLPHVFAVADAKVSAGKDSPAKTSGSTDTGGSKSASKSTPAAPAADTEKHAAAEASHADVSKSERAIAAEQKHAAADHQAITADPQSSAASHNKTSGERIASGATGSELTDSQLTGSELTGSELTGSQLTGSSLSGSQLTGFNAGFASPSFLGSFTTPSLPFIAADSSDLERTHRRLSLPVKEASHDPSPAADTASPLRDYFNANAQLLLAQRDYDAALVRVREQLNENGAYQQARAHQSDANSAPSSSAIASSDDAATVLEMESRGIATDPEASAAQQKLNQAVLARNSAERAQATPRAIANASHN